MELLRIKKSKTGQTVTRAIGVGTVTAPTNGTNNTNRTRTPLNAPRTDTTTTKEIKAIGVAKEVVTKIGLDGSTPLKTKIMRIIKNMIILNSTPSPKTRTSTSKTLK